MSKRTKFTPEKGAEYEQRSDFYTSVFRCIRPVSEGCAILRNTRSGWTFQAHGCGIYDNGQIDWDYSTGGTFE